MTEGRILLVDGKGRTYLVKGDSDVHTKDGVIKKQDLEGKMPGSTIETHIGRRFHILNPNIIDFMEKAKRGPQTISLKDCALIAGYAGLKSGSRVVEAGTGSGLLSMFIANIICPEKLISYEVREDFAGIARSNFERFNVGNVEIKLKSIYEGVDERELDLITLDLPEPWLVVEHAKKSLKVGGYLVSYSPSIEQSKKFYDALGSVFMEETFECIVRDWNMKTLRPHTRMLAHTGFITMARWLGSEIQGGDFHRDEEDDYAGES